MPKNISWYTMRILAGAIAAGPISLSAQLHARKDLIMNDRLAKADLFEIYVVDPSISTRTNLDRDGVKRIATKVSVSASDPRWACVHKAFQTATISARADQQIDIRVALVAKSHGQETYSLYSEYPYKAGGPGTLRGYSADQPVAISSSALEQLVACT